MAGDHNQIHFAPNLNDVRMTPSKPLSYAPFESVSMDSVSDFSTGRNPEAGAIDTLQDLGRDEFLPAPGLHNHEIPMSKPSTTLENASEVFRVQKSIRWTEPACRNPPGIHLIRPSFRMAGERLLAIDHLAPSRSDVASRAPIGLVVRTSTSTQPSLRDGDVPWNGVA